MFWKIFWKKIVLTKRNLKKMWKSVLFCIFHILILKIFKILKKKKIKVKIETKTKTKMKKKIKIKIKIMK